jgi:hypothetical protein
MRDFLSEASPFEIGGEGQIIYHRQYRNTDQLKPQFAFIENPIKISKLTTIDRKPEDEDKGI